MPGPTTEVLADDLKDLKSEIRDIRTKMATMMADVHAIALGVAEFKARADVFMGIAKWAATLLVATILTGGVSAVWWAAKSTERGEQLAAKVDRLAKDAEHGRENTLLRPEGLYEDDKPK